MSGDTAQGQFALGGRDDRPRGGRFVSHNIFSFTKCDEMDLLGITVLRNCSVVPAVTASEPADY